jgi:hypothetical protein
MVARVIPTASAASVVLRYFEAMLGILQKHLTAVKSYFMMCAWTSQENSENPFPKAISGVSGNEISMRV